MYTTHIPKPSQYPWRVKTVTLSFLLTFPLLLPKMQTLAKIFASLPPTCNFEREFDEDVKLQEMFPDQLENLVFIVQRCVLIGCILPYNVNFMTFFLDFVDFEKKCADLSKIYCDNTYFYKNAWKSIRRL